MIWAAIGLLVVVIVQNTVLLVKTRDTVRRIKYLESDHDICSRRCDMYLTRILDRLRTISEPIEAQITDTIKRMYFKANNEIKAKED